VPRSVRFAPRSLRPSGRSTALMAARSRRGGYFPLPRTAADICVRTVRKGPAVERIPPLAFGPAPPAGRAHIRRAARRLVWLGARRQPKGDSNGIHFRVVLALEAR
jgi:hypothetical protein